MRLISLVAQVSKLALPAEGGQNAILIFALVSRATATLESCATGGVLARRRGAQTYMAIALVSRATATLESCATGGVLARRRGAHTYMAIALVSRATATLESCATGGVLARRRGAQTYMAIALVPRATATLESCATGGRSIVSRVAYLALGANLGDRAARLREAISRLKGIEGVDVLRVSRVYETEPIGVVEQPMFLNMVVEVSVAEGTAARELLRLVKQIEVEMGRQERERWGPREIDIDVLLIGDERAEEADFELPHPRMWERAFVMVPLADLAPEMVTPGGERVVELAERLGREQGIHAYLSI